MARKTINFVSRQYTASQLLQLDPDAINKMSRRELSRVVSDLGDVANKRLNRLRSQGLESPASYSEGEWIKRFSVKGKTVGQLKSEYARVRTFLNAQTSTIKGAREWQLNSIRELANYGIKVNKQQFKEFWNAYSKIEQIDKRAGNNAVKYSVLKELQRELDDEVDVDVAISRISSRVTEIYEEQEEALNGLSSTAKLFNEQGKRKRPRGFGRNR